MKIPKVIRSIIGRIVEKSLPEKGWAVKDRPHFGPRQVRTPAGIKPGSRLIIVTRNSRDHIIVRSEPYPNPGDWDWEPVGPVGDLVFEYTFEGENRRHRMLLWSAGVVPDERGRWNPTRHLLRTGRKRLTTEEMKSR